ncbi:hypothetical protein V1517DRAFT_310018 [Lipomyces orientalis]|uniref:Uncharacterized protein n=1 Tax=Lipomyces orientalis TaxID=1233043 RepID=A0ACC3TGC2_9ASCO
MCLVRLSSSHGDDGPYYVSHPSHSHYYGSSSCLHHHHHPSPHHSSHPVVCDPHYHHHHQQPPPPHYLQTPQCRSSRRSRLFATSHSDPDVEAAVTAAANAAAQAVKDVEIEHHHQPNDVSAYMEGYRAGRRGL